VLERVGGGGVGVVFAAHDPELQRKVAVKLLQPATGRGAGAKEAGERLQREAQAMARVSHPNVIAVYEVGRAMVDDRDQVYIAMELVEGMDLRHWLREKHSWRAIRDRFLAAGRGLAAAHRADLVHRDFKPSNVLVGDDGRVRVLDFGLAKLAIDDRRSSSTGGSDYPAGDLTEVGVVMGTPPYMAPEQHTGRVVDDRGDQYAFCVSLYEGLFGVRPFKGKTLEELLESKMELDLNPPSADAGRVPRWLERAVLKGLQPSPQDRYPSMDVLLRAIDRDPGRAVARWGVGGAIGVAVFAVAYGQGRSDADPCATVSEELVGAWDDALRQEVQESFAVVAFGESSVGPLMKRLDEHADQWQERRMSLCREEEASGKPDRGLLERRVCLDRNRSELAELTRLLADADRTIVENAGHAIASLPPPSDCDHPPTLPPGWNDTDRERVERVEGFLARSLALLRAGKHAQAELEAETAHEQAVSAAYRQGEAVALQRLGSVAQARGRFEDAERHFLDALQHAERLGDDRMVARLLVELVYLLGVDLGKHEESLRWAQLAEAKLERVSDEPHELARLLTYRGLVYEQLARHDEAVQSHREAIAIQRDRKGDGSLEEATTLTNLGNALIAQGKYEEALEHHQLALSMTGGALGEEHPGTISARANVATALLQLGRLEEAKTTLKANLALAERIYGKTHPVLAMVLNNLGSAQRRSGDSESALVSYQEALRISKEVLGEEHPTTNGLRSNVGSALASLGRTEEAMQQLQTGLEGWAAALGPDHPNLAFAHLAIGQLHASEGRIEKAREAVTRAVEIRRSALRPGHPLTVEAEEALAELDSDQR